MDNNYIDHYFSTAANVNTASVEIGVLEASA